MGCCLNRIDGAAGGGDLTGPASVTDSTVALWDGTTGNVLKDSGVSIDGSNNVVVPGNVRRGRRPRTRTTWSLAARGSTALG